jgi:hypothetical protein
MTTYRSTNVRKLVALAERLATAGHEVSDVVVPETWGDVPYLHTSATYWLISMALRELRNEK